MPQHALTGTILITFNNCSVKVNDETFENMEWKTRQRFVMLPFFNISIKQRNIDPLIDLHQIQELHIKTSQKLLEIHTKNLNIEESATYILIIAAIVIAIIIGLIAYAYIKIYSSMNPVRDVLKLTAEGLSTEPAGASSKPSWQP